MSLLLNFSAGDFVFASAPHLFFLGKKRLSYLPLVPRSTRAADPFFCGFVRNARETPEERLVLSTYMGYSVF